MRIKLLVSLFVAASASSSFAATHEWEGYGVTIPPGEVYEQDLSCETGKLLSGGYVIDSAIRRDEPLGKIVVIADAPFNDKGWYVAFYNSHDAAVAVEFRIALLCE